MAPRIVLSDDELSKIGQPVAKGRRLAIGDLDKIPARLTGAGWDAPKVAGEKIDLDLVTLMLCIDDGPVAERTDSGLYVASRDRLVHYNPKNRKAKVRDASGAVEYQGDSVDGEESLNDEDEFMRMEYPLIPPDVVALMTLINIHKQSDSTPFVKRLTFDQIGRAFVSSFPEGAQNDPKRKRVIRLDDTKFQGTDTIVVKFDWRRDEGWEEEFVEQHVQHLPQFADRPNAGFLSAVWPYGLG